MHQRSGGSDISVYFADLSSEVRYFIENKNLDKYSNKYQELPYYQKQKNSKILEIFFTAIFYVNLIFPTLINKINYIRKNDRSVICIQ